MDLQNCSAEDLALNEKFQQWVLNPNAEVNQFWTNWMSENPGKAQDVSLAKELVLMAGLSTDTEANEAYLDVWKNLRQNAEGLAAEVKPNKTYHYSRIAAIFIGIALISAYFLLRPMLTAGNLLEYKSSFGEIKEIVLPDGSTATLNAGSVLSFAKNWNGHNARQVTLTGEAFFKVQKTKDLKPFVVKTADDISIQVLGTEFNVKTRREKVEVYLHTGKVSLQSNTTENETLLSPGDFAACELKTGHVTIRKEAAAGVEKILAWKSSFFVYNDVPLTQIIQDLEDEFGVKVTVKDARLYNMKFTGRVPRKDYTVLLQVLAETLDISITHRDNQITINTPT